LTFGTLYVTTSLALVAITKQRGTKMCFLSETAATVCSKCGAPGSLCECRTKKVSSDRPKISDAQFGVLHQLLEFGPITAEEIKLPPAMDGSRRTKLRCNYLTAATMQKLEIGGFISVRRESAKAPVNAVGESGRQRRTITIEITGEGRAAISE
jgi:hypothetical protein